MGSLCGVGVGAAWWGAIVTSLKVVIVGEGWLHVLRSR